MYIISESEKLSDSSRRICYYYKCPSCGFRIDLEYINVAPSNEFIIVKRKILLHPFLSSSL
ncbi:MAG: hypothetical protein DRO40_04540 [Thermoprotei archaeon]|nr:MAG: hypothetical protein DRO40_04540 [Thermoprotei archaeon]